MLSLHDALPIYRLTYNLEHIKLALAHDVIGERVVGIYVFLCGNGGARCNSPDDGNVAHARRSLRQKLVLRRFIGSFTPRLGLFVHGEFAKVYRACRIWSAAQETFLRCL